VRREDPRIAARIRAALGDARTLLNVGAGAGAYEPADLDVVAVEPSEVMRSQRPPGAAPAVDAAAEALPFADGSFDAAMAVLSDHHWTDHDRGLAEMRRVARRRVLYTWEPRTAREGWVVRDYFPGFTRFPPPGYGLERTLEKLGGAAASSRCRSPTTAWTGSSTPTGAVRRRTWTRTSAPASRSSRC
jgi:SAM-dependent methyltransferase